MHGFRITALLPACLLGKTASLIFRIVQLG
jgi:hypothetical protein